MHRDRKPGRRTIYLASHNPHKAHEFASMLDTGSLAIKSCNDLGDGIAWEETGDTFIANARIKAQAVRRKTVSSVLADDSGLVVPALEGQPGVFSSRYAGPQATDTDNLTKLLAEMNGLNQREAYFVCVLVFVAEDGAEHVFEGRCEGRILQAPQGNRGFGYDPVFFFPPHGKTLAEMTAPEKNTISHRAVAVRALQKFLAQQDASRQP